MVTIEPSLVEAFTLLVQENHTSVPEAVLLSGDQSAYGGGLRFQICGALAGVLVIE